jgi:hypothetical protein
VVIDLATIPYSNPGGHIAHLAGALMGFLYMKELQKGRDWGGWMKIGLAISVVTTPVFMAGVYFLVLTPTGLLMRLFGRNPLKPAREAGSYWVTRPEGQRRSSLDRQF